MSDEKRTTVIMVREDELLRLLSMVARRAAPWETEATADEIAREVYAWCGERSLLASVESPR